MNGLSTLRITFINVPPNYPSSENSLEIPNVINSTVKDGVLYIQHQLADTSINLVAYPLYNIFCYSTRIDTRP